MVLPSIAIVIMILQLNPTISNAIVNDTASKWCVGAKKNCLIGDLNSDSEFLMETQSNRMLQEFQSLQTPRTNDRDKESVPGCGRPRYDSCLGSKTGISNPENCDPRNRVNPNC